jgi:macrodomain Ter protein organizer (MatP/YcbG family)
MNKKKGVMINLDFKVIQILKSLAETNSSSMSQEVRRLILDEEQRTERNLRESNKTL